ncbi:hypothetical protein I2494_04580 [Budviciaceae bacterium BWR-B9]|uniref:Uncharacterized protein n=1 Tax=Limnobaculum allomyrinae TaxID=2791986 RepID=A0ABS1IMP3_9GAMM|nr:MULTISPECIES: hypothetical protein [Limnobaculum]MBK5142997.1 hypothetical protein [Limnobaculum allomyrinae]MBV7693327.1 hypothetical protein [Limnobaculum sp. M2-1]
MISKIGRILFYSIISLSCTASIANDALSIPKDSQWKYLTTNVNGKYSIRMDYIIAPRHPLYPPDWAQVWLKEEVLDCTDLTCGSITRHIVDCVYRPKGFVQEQRYDYDIHGKRIFTDSGQKPFKDYSDYPSFIKLYDTACAETADARSKSAAEKKAREDKSAAKKAKELAKKSPYDRSLPLTYNPDGTGGPLANEAYILFEDGRQVARGVSDKNGNIPYKLNKNSTYIIQFAYGKFTLDPVRKTRRK